ncbi:MAG: bifunctional 5,10-methylenetetrahydrofolate dehydrogenase/5,10-methenyltetrahydrofolate cyclohydrolase [Planctomycetaceae bacterium]|nr:bifunctional 5,10-methylenetetrahydrofolate dehydrogenase/5,10-methenyltetrahydrofolate cyclohydrolase [Planctomycetaceae bacterium]
MPAKIIDGEPLAAKMLEQVAADAQALAAAGNKPKLAALLIGDSAPSKMYAKSQAQQCAAAGIDYELIELPENISQADALARVQQINADRSISGLLLLMPFPKQIDARLVQQTIAPSKDVEGMGPANMGKLFYGGGIVSPCTAAAAVELLKATAGNLAGLEVVVVGHSEIVGKPIAAILLQSLSESPTVTVCHVATKDLAFHTRRADVVFVATGVPQVRWNAYSRKKKAGENPPLPDLKGLIKGDMLKEGAIVIDVAINRIPKALDADGNPVLNDKGKPAMITVGDVDFESAKEKVGAITPVPGGVGPVTVAILLRNTIACAKANA